MPLPGSDAPHSLMPWVIPHHTKEAVQIRKKNASSEGRGKQELSPSRSKAFEGLCFPFPSPLHRGQYKKLTGHVAAAGTMPTIFPGKCC